MSPSEGTERPASGPVDSAHDEFVALAFTAADLLVEIEQTGQITFLAGPALGLGGTTTDRLLGHSFPDLVAEADRATLDTLLLRVKQGEPIKPVGVGLHRGGGSATVFGGCRLPNGRLILFLTLTGEESKQGIPPREIAAGLMSREEFQRIAMDRLRESTAGVHRLTFIAIEGLAAFRQRIGLAGGRTLLAAVARQVLVNGEGIEAAGEIGEGRYGLLHTGAVDTGSLRGAVKALARALDPEGPDLRLSTATIDLDRGELSDDDAARAVLYAVDQFAGRGSSNSPTGLTAGSEQSGDDLLGGFFAAAAVRVSSLRNTLQMGAFDIAFQPIVDLMTRQVKHSEALARFPGTPSPIETISFAEDVGLIAEFDLAVCTRVVRHLAAMPEHPPVAVNLSGRSLENARFAAALNRLLAPHGDLGGQLLFELTESAIITQMNAVDEAIQGLRRKGYKFCLDDFGAGGNSFHYLRSFAVDFVKIDGYFGHAALSNPRDRSFLRYVSGFCRENGVVTIAEMIETEEHAEGFRALDIDYGQGYLFGEPRIELTRS